jgi:hypothetical protein
MVENPPHALEHLLTAQQLCLIGTATLWLKEIDPERVGADIGKPVHHFAHFAVVRSPQYSQDAAGNPVLLKEAQGSLHGGAAASELIVDTWRTVGTEAKNNPPRV